MKLALTTAAILLAAAAAHAAPAGVIKSKIGNVLVAKNGMTLYTFRKDAKNKSNCYGGCAASWPPMFASKNAKADGGFTLIKRKDGKMQWAKNGQPLYFWIKDRKSGDTTGHGVGNVWDAARP